ncbi:MAG: hypothetical protein QOF24_2138 [Verrucomicrobiota bacterium]|jgi:hypothetical protein
MFPLFAKNLPPTAEALQALLNESLRQLFTVTRDPVTIRDSSYPHIRELDVSLDGAQLRRNPPPIPSLSGDATPALEADLLTVNASKLSVGPASIDLSLSAREVQFTQSRDANDEIVISIDNAADGAVEISTSQPGLEALIAEVAKTEASKHGVTIDGVQLTLRSKSSRSLAAEVRFSAKKLFFSASIRITGQLDLDEELNARISGLNCAGDGAIATMACGVLKPHLEKIDGREFRLMSLPLGKIRLRDVQLAVGDRLSVTAQFGSIA